MKLRKVYIEITNACNLRCKFCACSEGNTDGLEKRFMSACEFEHILTQVKPLTDYVYLHVLGEPLMHPELGRLLLICGKYGMKASVTTNSTLINIKQKELLHKPCLKQINYSLHSLAEYENGRHTKRVLAEVFEFTGKAAGVYHNLRLWNEGGEESGEFNKEIIREIEKLFGVRVTGKDRQVLGERLSLHFAKRFEWPGGEGSLFTKGKCMGLTHDCAILCDGTVVPCCLDYRGSMSLGNIYEKSLLGIISGDRAQNIKSGFSRSEVMEEFCRSCGFAAERFGEG